MAHLRASSLTLSSLEKFTPKKQIIFNKTTHGEKYSDEANLPPTSANMAQESEIKSHRIWLSNVVVRRPNNSLVRRKWRKSGVRRLIVVIIVHGLAMFAPFTFTWDAFWVAFVLYMVTMLFGVIISFHRNLTHSAFSLPKWLEYSFAYCGCLALQGDPIGWVRTHRYHHKSADSVKDPHSPHEGFWHSHINWIFDTATLAEKREGTSIVRDLETQQFYRFMRSTYLLHNIALVLFLYVLGGFSYIVWGMGVRTTYGLHSVFSLNSVCHIWGYQAWNTGDLSKNNWWIGFLAGGEGWHNNHHAFEYSARCGLEWWQIDVAWYIIKFLEAIGLAKDVKLPTEAHKRRLALKADGSKD